MRPGRLEGKIISGDYLMKNSGFTLAELLITVTIVGILAALAIPSYTRHVERGRMMQACSDIQTVAMYSEKYNMHRGTYTYYPYLTSSMGLKVVQDQRQTQGKFIIYIYLYKKNNGVYTPYDYTNDYLNNIPANSFVAMAIPGSNNAFNGVPCITSDGRKGYMPCSITNSNRSASSINPDSCAAEEWTGKKSVKCDVTY